MNYLSPRFQLGLLADIIKRAPRHPLHACRRLGLMIRGDAELIAAEVLRLIAAVLRRFDPIMEFQLRIEQNGVPTGELVDFQLRRSEYRYCVALIAKRGFPPFEDGGLNAILREVFARVPDGQKA